MPSPVLLQSGGGAAVALLVWLLTLALLIAAVVWTYSDAQRNSTHPAFLWAIVVFFAPLVGLVLYLILGRNRR